MTRDRLLIELGAAIQQVTLQYSEWMDEAEKQHGKVSKEYTEAYERYDAVDNAMRFLKEHLQESSS